MAKQFKLDRRLSADTHKLTCVKNIQILLHKNATIPWFILVPETNHTEWIDLSEQEQQEINSLVNALGKYFKNCCGVEKLNVATIGNVVAQMHIHVVGRSKSDPCWPGVVWGRDYVFKHYSDEKLAEKRSALKALF